MNNSIINFLFPSFNAEEILSVVFFLIIWSIFFITIIRVYLHARPENWQKNWFEEDETTAKLDPEHSSIEDISHTVSTPAERWADVAPGIILIIGLLGTFIGLGLALDKASSILSGINTAGMDNAMNQLMGMMEGLGTKFKTSTWGLMAFIFLKIFFGFNKYEVRRLNWCTQKIKNELKVVRTLQLKEEQASHQSLIDTLKSIINEMTTLQQTASEVNKKAFSALLAQNHQATQTTHNNQTEQKQLLSEMVNKSALFSENMLKQSQQQLDLIIQNQSIQQNNFKQLTIANTHHQETSQLLNKNIQESQAARKAMESFVQNHQSTISSLGKSASKMSSAADSMGGSAQELQNVIEHFRVNMDKVMADMSNIITQMKVELSDTIHEMNHEFSGNMNKMRKNLQETINDMNQSFRDNMTNMSQNLSLATQDISKAVSDLSSSVDKTMQNVTSTIQQSMNMQEKNSRVFTETSETLNIKIESMTNLVNKLSNDIISGLKAISESNRNVISLNKRYNSISEQVEDIVHIMNKLNQTMEQSIEASSSLFTIIQHKLKHKQ